MPRVLSAFLLSAAKLALLAALLPLHGTLLAQSTPSGELPQQAFGIALDEDPPLDPQLHTGVFDNGIRYYIRENREPADRAELRLVVDAGSILEDDSQRGLAHFLEHMAFNGTENFEKQELVSFMESIGMRMGPGINASTSFDETIYQLQLPTDDPENLDTAFQIMEDWIGALTLEVEEIDMERGVVIEEWRRGLGAQSRIRDQQIPVLLKDSRYAERLPIGTLENLQNFEPEELRRFYRDWYRPELMGVVAVGDFDAARVETLIREHFGDIPATADPEPRPRFDVPSHAETLFSIATDPEVPVTQVALIHKKLQEYDWTVGGYRQSIVERLYHAMLNTRFQEMTREANPPFLGASSGETSIVRPTSAYVMTAVAQEDGIDRALRALLTEAERVARFGFNREELERQKTALLRLIEQSYANRDSRNSGALAAELIRAHLTGESVPGIPYELALNRRFIPEITLAEVNQVGRDWIGERDRVVTVVMPEKEGLTPPDEEHLLSVIDSVADAEISAREEQSNDKQLLAEIPEGSPVVASEELGGGITRWTLGNGVTVLLKPTQFRQDEIIFRAFSPGGTSIADDENLIPAQTATTIIGNGGLGEFTAVELQRELTGKLANVAPVISDYEEGFQGSGSPADLETLLKLIYLRATEPRADPTFYEIFRTQMRTVLQNRSANPAAEFEDTFNRLLYRDHPRRQPPSVEMLEHTDLEESLAFYRDRFADASDFTFVFVGNIDMEAMQPLVERYLGGLPSTGRQESWVDRGIRPPEGVVTETVRRGLEPQSSTRIAFTGPFDILDRFERTRLQAASLVLETRLRNVIREQLGGTYNVSVGRNISWRPEHSYMLTISFGSDPERVGELTEALFDEIDALRREGPDEKELEDARQALLRNYETGLNNNANWVSQIVYALYSDTQPLSSEIFAFPETLDALSVESMQDALARYLDLDNYIHVTLLPEN